MPIYYIHTEIYTTSILRLRMKSKSLGFSSIESKLLSVCRVFSYKTNEIIHSIQLIELTGSGYCAGQCVWAHNTLMRCSDENYCNRAFDANGPTKRLYFYLFISIYKKEIKHTHSPILTHARTSSCFYFFLFIHLRS